MDQDLLDEFRKLVRQEMVENGTSFVLAVYLVHDRQLKKEIEDSGKIIACQKGCSVCCRELISCTEMEIDEITIYIRRLPKKIRRPLIVRLKKAAVKWSSYCQKNEIFLRKPVEPYQFKPFYDLAGKPCPFLNEKDNSCSIYPVRIIDCRAFINFKRCSKENKAFRSQTSELASYLIMERQKLIEPIRSLVTVPVHAWLAKKLL